jgi:phosphate acyltransferase
VTRVIAVDAMGGDLAPDEIVRGIAAASLQTDIQCILIGDEHRIQEILERSEYNPEHIDIHPASEVIGMAEDPKDAVRHKRDASILVAARLVAEGRADALVSAGNTGAAVLACARHFKVIPGIRKTALASVYPRQTEYPGQDHLALLLDVGATVRCEALELVQFAIMGSAYAKRISKVASPRVALLNMGSEPSKGSPELVQAHRVLQTLSGLNFIGNIEGNDLVKGKADVIVCEGLVGNVALKLLEGLAEVLVYAAGAAAGESWRWRLGMRMLSGGVERLRELVDYTSYGGAPILGFQNIFIKAHGRSPARAIANAAKVAAKAARDGVPEEIAAGVAAIR